MIMLSKILNIHEFSRILAVLGTLMLVISPAKADLDSADKAELDAMIRAYIQDNQKLFAMLFVIWPRVKRPSRHELHSRFLLCLTVTPCLATRMAS